MQFTVAVSELIGLHSHLASYEQEQIAHVGVAVCGSTTETIVLTGIVELIPIKVALVEIEMSTVLETAGGTPGQNQRQVGIAMTVTVSHTASKKGHRGVEQRFAIKIGRLGEAGQEIGKLFHGKGIAHGEFLHVTGIPVVMAQFVSGLGNAQFGNGEALPLEAAAESRHPGRVGLESEHDQIVDRSEVGARLGLGNVLVGSIAVGIGDLRDAAHRARNRPAGCGSRFPGRR